MPPGDMQGWRLDSSTYWKQWGYLGLQKVTHRKTPQEKSLLYLGPLSTFKESKI